MSDPTKYCAGPWTWDKDTFGHYELTAASGDKVIEIVSGPDPDLPRTPCLAIWGHDASLIQAAPAMYEACKAFEEWLRREDEGPKYPAGTNRDTSGNERIWSDWYYGNLDLCKVAQEKARAALALAEGKVSP